MCAKALLEAQNPLILRSLRLIEAFAKADDERDFYIDRQEGFLIFVDLDKPQAELDALEKELSLHESRYCQIPRLSFYEAKKIMENFVNEKVYDIDTKEKLLDIIQSKEAKENFLEFIFDHHHEQEKWQQFYQERSRVRIIEWLRQNHFHFVFEEDLELPRQVVEKLKHALFQPKVGKDILDARKTLVTKAKTYYSNEALHPRPKRGRPPKQVVKLEVEPQITMDIYTTVPAAVTPFLFIPDISPSSPLTAFSSLSGEERRRGQSGEADLSLDQKLASLRALSSRWVQEKTPTSRPMKPSDDFSLDEDWSEDEDDDESDDSIPPKKVKPTPVKAQTKPAVVAPKKKKEPPPPPKKKPAAPAKASAAKKPLKKLSAPPKAKPVIKKPAAKSVKAAPLKKGQKKRIMPKQAAVKKPVKNHRR